jgi:hypothetical protein
VYSHIILDYFKDGRITNDSLKDRLQNKMGAAYELEKIAIRKGIATREPFQGMDIGGFHVLSPDRQWYVHDLIKDFEKSPDARVIKTTRLDSTGGILGFFTEAAKRAVEWVAERWDQESLREDIETSAENESSVILFGYMKDHQDGILLTGDAGILALRKAGEYLLANNIDPARVLKFVQIPHHGGRHNVSTTVLDMLLGGRLSGMPAEAPKTAFVSAGLESEYPRKMVANAFLRRGCRVIATKGQTKRHSRGMPAREGWVPVASMEYSHQVEGW